MTCRKSYCRIAFRVFVQYDGTTGPATLERTACPVVLAGLAGLPDTATHARGRRRGAYPVGQRGEPFWRFCVGAAAWIGATGSQAVGGGGPLRRKGA